MNISTNSSKFFVITLFFALLGCSSQDTGEGNHESHEQQEHHTEESLSVELTGRQIEAVGIEVGDFSKLPLRNAVKTNGTLELPPQKKADVNAFVSGAVTAIHVVEGDRVTKGQELARLEDPHIVEIQQDYIETSAQLDYLKQDYERKKNLSDEEVGSQRELQQVASEYHSASARATGLKAKLELLGLDPGEVLQGTIRASLPIRAPLDGVIQTVEVNTGSYIAPGQNLFEIVDNSHIHADLMVYEKDLHKVKEGQIVYFRYTNQPNDQINKARIFAVGKAFEQDPKAVRVHAELTDQQPNLLPGMYVEAWIVTDSTQVLALPEDAIVSDGGSSYVFITEGGRSGSASLEPVAQANSNSHGSLFKAVEVVTGTRDNNFVEVKLLEELPEDAQVVTNGAFFILSEMKKGEGGHGH